MFVVERIYDNMTLKELYHDYITGGDIPLNTKLQDVEKIVKELLKEEIKNGYRNKVTGAKTNPNQEVEHKISFRVYYKNKGTKAVPKTVQVINNLQNTSVIISEKEIIDERCSWYVYDITTNLADENFPKLLYDNGASSVYLNN